MDDIKIANAQKKLLEFLKAKDLSIDDKIVLLSSAANMLKEIANQESQIAFRMKMINGDYCGRY